MATDHDQDGRGGSGGGYVRAYRRAWRNPIFRDLIDASIWQYLFQNAAWTPMVVRFRGQRVRVDRAQFYVSRRVLAGPDGFNCSESKIRALFSRLEAADMATFRTTKIGTLVTITNYDQYQTDDAPLLTRAKEQPTDDKPNEGTRLPADWRPIGDDFEFADTRGFSAKEIQRIADRFVRHYTNAVGAAGARLDWSPIWQNWIVEDARRRSKLPERTPARNRESAYHQGLASSKRVIAGIAKGKTSE